VTGQTWRMSPVSRGRKRKRNGRKIAREGPGPPCPTCPADRSTAIARPVPARDSTGRVDRRVGRGRLVPAGNRRFAGRRDRWRVAGAIRRGRSRRIPGGVGRWAGAGDRPAASTEALAVLLAIGSVAPPPAGEAASAAADRLIEAGVARPGWANELAQPVEVTECRLLADPAGSASILSARSAGPGTSTGTRSWWRSTTRTAARRPASC